LIPVLRQRKYILHFVELICDFAWLRFALSRENNQTLWRDTMKQKEVHVVIGAGQVGMKLAELLVDAGHDVRIVRRGPAKTERLGLTWYRGDVTDADFMDRACAGADVMYHCANPADYNGWDGVLQPMFYGILGAASRSGAKLVVLDNLYMIGRPAQSPFDESVPMQPCSKKGALRKELADALREAHERGEVCATTGRASDFFGPDTPLSVFTSPRFYERLQKGQPLEYMGDPDLPRSYSYTPDVARGLMALGASDEANGKIWNLPVVPNMTSRTFLEAFAQATGHSGKTTKLHKWMFQLMGIFVSMVRGIPEMYYQWEVPYELDDSAFRKTFGFGATPLEQAVRETIAQELPELSRVAPSAQAGQVF
jgi:nucleoside-diphosphate-sugar epimerase